MRSSVTFWQPNSIFVPSVESPRSFLASVLSIGANSEVSMGLGTDTTSWPFARALVRAMEARAGIVLLDEPYTGMDAATRERAEAYIRLRQRERVIVIATHI